jgi:hypothetical protein
MGDDHNHNRECNVRERILRFIEAEGQNGRKRLTETEAQSLRSAAGRLDQLLARVAEEEQARSKQLKEEEVRALSTAAGKLDQILTRIPAREVTQATQSPVRKKNSE